MKTRTSLIPQQPIEQLIQTVRGRRVILDTDLAIIYGVLTWRLNEQIKRNKERFPADFMFTPTMEENRALTSQIAMSKKGRCGRRHRVRRIRPGFRFDIANCSIKDGGW